MWLGFIFPISVLTTCLSNMILKMPLIQSEETRYWKLLVTLFLPCFPLSIQHTHHHHFSIGDLESSEEIQLGDPLGLLFCLSIHVTYYVLSFHIRVLDFLP